MRWVYKHAHTTCTQYTQCCSERAGNGAYKGEAEGGGEWPVLTGAANSTEVDGGEGAAKAAGDKGGAEVRANDGRRQEAAPVPSRDGRAAGDPAVPEEHGASDPEAAVSATCARDRAGFQDRLAVSVVSDRRAAGGRRGVSRLAL
ncbi:histone H3 [Pneumocystis jirovecii RU7]|uniref:Histone H3 n=1 Tax=Pneumocystis jirovecii (strain RU7) TaxID=1408657 RepID=A0A0W4ZQ09_PNEJ7|nr:histone H3 [Pneumocystis jirovecii RU7]KTW30447.1 histone H3 [Pneumocystis jirovecii RU7]